MTTAENRAIGALVGLATGNALGASCTGTPREMLGRVTEMRYGGPYNLQPGDWTARE
jgi:ADP-ribosyl-[dinitrogen reductase] hydrolase